MFNSQFRSDSAGGRECDPSINAWDISIIQTWTNSLCHNNHSPYLVVLKTFSFFISFIRHHFYFYIIFVLKLNIVFAFVSVNDGQNIFVSVIVTVTEISLSHDHRFSFFLLFLFNLRFRPRGGLTSVLVERLLFSIVCSLSYFSQSFMTINLIKTSQSLRICGMCRNCYLQFLRIISDAKRWRWALTIACASEWHNGEADCRAGRNIVTTSGAIPSEFSLAHR